MTFFGQFFVYTMTSIRTILIYAIFGLPRQPHKPRDYCTYTTTFLVMEHVDTYDIQGTYSSKDEMCLCISFNLSIRGTRVSIWKQHMGGNDRNLWQISSQIHTGQKEVNESDSQKTILKIVCMFLRTLLSEIIAALLMKLIWDLRNDFRNKNIIV